MEHVSKIEPSAALKAILEEAKTPQCVCRVGNYVSSCPFMTPREWQEVEEWIAKKSQE